MGACALVPTQRRRCRWPEPGARVFLILPCCSPRPPWPQFTHAEALDSSLPRPGWFSAGRSTSSGRDPLGAQPRFLHTRLTGHPGSGSSSPTGGRRVPGAGPHQWRPAARRRAGPRPGLCSGVWSIHAVTEFQLHQLRSVPRSPHLRNGTATRACEDSTQQTAGMEARWGPAGTGSPSCGTRPSLGLGREGWPPRVGVQVQHLPPLSTAH